jgi:hypothetical protein
MIPPNNVLFHFLDWIVDRLGLGLDLRKDGIVDSLDEEEIDEQLQYGRD